MGVARDTIARSRGKFPPRHDLQPQRESRTTALLIRKLFAGLVWVVNATPRLFYHWDGTLVLIEEEDGRVTGQVRTGAEHLHRGWNPEPYSP
jgi:hypothetical protein